MAQVDDNPIDPIIYIDFSGEKEGKQAQGSYGSIHLAWTSPDRSESSEMFAVKVPRAHRTGHNVGFSQIRETDNIEIESSLHTFITRS